MKKRYIIAIVVLSIIGVFIIGTLTSFFQSYNQFDRTRYKVYIEQGASVKSIADILQAKNILGKNNSFYLGARLLGVENRLQAGIYELSPSDSLIWLLLKLKTGAIMEEPSVDIAVPEGTSIYKIGSKMQDLGIADYEDFRDFVDTLWLKELKDKYSFLKGIPNRSLEGYLYPDTYRINRSTSAEVLADMMLRRFEDKVIPFWKEASKDTKYNLHQIITLASIIEKEAAVPSERPVISSVFHNRLKIGMPLAADPTVKYALENPTKRVLFGQLGTKSPYNTYKRKGLPPGPICNPGIESIRAAVYPAKTDYFFFVAKKDKTHIFSRSFEEHQKARLKVLERGN